LINKKSRLRNQFKCVIHVTAQSNKKELTKSVQLIYQKNISFNCVINVIRTLLVNKRYFIYDTDESRNPTHLNLSKSKSINGVIQ
jgi:predicted transcriptional regulator